MDFISELVASTDDEDFAVLLADVECLPDEVLETLAAVLQSCAGRGWIAATMNSANHSPLVEMLLLRFFTQTVTRARVATPDRRPRGAGAIPAARNHPRGRRPTLPRGDAPTRQAAVSRGSGLLRVHAQTVQADRETDLHRYNSTRRRQCAQRKPTWPRTTQTLHQT